MQHWINDGSGTWTGQAQSLQQIEQGLQQAKGDISGWDLGRGNLIEWGLGQGKPSPYIRGI